jgi:hypothetical protein
MDLLGGYDSDDGSSSSSLPDQNDSYKNGAVVAKPQLAVQPPSMAPTIASKPTIQKGKKKGSRILSLAAVLPQHILDQLTKATSSSSGGGGNNGYYDDDSDDDDDDDYFRPPPPKAKPGSSTVSSTNSMSSSTTPKILHSKDPELTSFLAELKATKSSSTKTKQNNNNNNHREDASSSDNTSSAPPKTVLGAAFITSTVETTIVRKTKQQPIVRNVHGGESRSATQSAAVTTSVPTAEPFTTHTKMHLPPTQSLETVMKATKDYTIQESEDDNDKNDDDRNEDEEQDGAPEFPSPSAPPPASSGTHRPMMMMMMPRAVRAAPSLAPSVAVRATPSTTYSYASSTSAPSAPYPPPQAQQQQQQPIQSKKARRRQLEQMLRAGNTAGITGDIQLEGQAPDQYLPEEQTYQAPASHGVRVVPVSMYGSAGATTTGADISGKQRSKHQLNALMANAASLEHQRARAPFSSSSQQGPSSSSSSGTTHRANAKRKYGW